MTSIQNLPLEIYNGYIIYNMLFILMLFNVLFDKLIKNKNIFNMYLTYSIIYIIYYILTIIIIVLSQFMTCITNCSNLHARCLLNIIIQHAGSTQPSFFFFLFVEMLYFFFTDLDIAF